MHNSSTTELPSLRDLRVAVIGLGHVGLPLAVEFGNIRSFIGFDISPARIAPLRRGEDDALEVDGNELASATDNYVLYDLKNVLASEQSDFRL